MLVDPNRRCCDRCGSEVLPETVDPSLNGAVLCSICMRTALATLMGKAIDHGWMPLGQLSDLISQVEYKIGESTTCGWSESDRTELLGVLGRCQQEIARHVHRSAVKRHEEYAAQIKKVS